MEGRSASYATPPQQFLTIVTEMISQDDRARLIVAMSTFKTGAQAKREASSKGLAYTPLDPMGRAGVLKWHGIEVGLIFKRDTVRPTVIQMEQLAAKPITDQDDAWLFINLLDTSRDALIPELQRKLTAAEHRIEQLNGLVANMQIVVDGSIDPELYEASRKETQVQQTTANKYFRALQRINPALAKQLAGSPVRPRPNRRDLAQEGKQSKMDRKHAAEEKLRFMRAVREEAKRLIELDQRRKDRAAKKAAKAAAAATTTKKSGKVTKTKTAKSGKPQAGAKTKKSKRP
jgi:hypothetical protein